MLSLLSDILCWIKQLGAAFLAAIVGAFNYVLAALVALVNGAIAAWPIGMPDLPAIPATMLTVFGWFQWGPIGIVTGGCLAFFIFSVSVMAAVVVAGPVLRWLKVWD